MHLKADIASYKITKNYCNTINSFRDIRAEILAITEKSLGQIGL